MEPGKDPRDGPKAQTLLMQLFRLEGQAETARRRRRIGESSCVGHSVVHVIWYLVYLVYFYIPKYSQIHTKNV